ncbi:uncharacterized protein LOC136091980 [Hydra vulgaris]|uniref:Uncharacterized protein LOC136091980 n=1 Tax=Hydra vulgaris TaxID=6087 RepID=A0ABM4DMJ5_HYDVU
MDIPYLEKIEMLVEVEKFLKNPNIEQIFCVIELGNEKILYGSIYRTGNSYISNCINITKSIKFAHSKKLSNKYTGILICGDFNFHTIRWTEDYYGELTCESDNKAKIFLECLNNCFMHQNVMEPTFQNNIGDKTNVLDFIITENKNRVYKLAHLPSLGGHHTITFNYSYTEKCIDNNVFKKDKFNQGKFYELNNYLKIINWKDKFKVKENIRAIQLKNGSIVTDLKVIANTLNGYFASVFIKPQDLSVPIIEIETQNFCRNPDFNVSVVEEYLSKLDTNKATGMKKVHPKVLKQCKSALAKTLSLMFNKSVETSKLPKLWSCANIIQLFKNGNKLDPSNYKPVSLTSVVYKVIETIIKDKMMKYLVDNKLIIKNQQGFVNNKSCVTNLLESLDFVTNSIDIGWNVIVLFLDFAKAFDSIDHERLMLKLDAFGF